MSVYLKKENDITIYVIDKDVNTFEVEMARKGFEKKNQILGLIRDGDDIFTCSYPVQIMYEINQGDNDYTISISNNLTKIRTLEKENDLMYENIISVDYENRELYIVKYVHTLKHSTIEAKTYSNINGGNLSYDESHEIIISSLEKIKNINIFEKYIDIDKLELFFKELNIYKKPSIQK